MCWLIITNKSIWQHRPKSSLIGTLYSLLLLFPDRMFCRIIVNYGNLKSSMIALWSVEQFLQSTALSDNYSKDER